jgi:hypothetical protein
VFERIVRAAEVAATNVGQSRRGFLGLLGRGAMAAAALLGGVFVSTAAGQSGGVVCCKYRLQQLYKRGHSFYVVCQAAGTTCSPSVAQLQQQYTRASCDQC